MSKTTATIILGILLVTVILGSLFFACAELNRQKASNQTETNLCSINITNTVFCGLEYNKHKYILVRWTAIRDQVAEISNYQFLHDPDCPCQKKMIEAIVDSRLKSNQKAEK
jgi:hypothetical protein